MDVWITNIEGNGISPLLLYNRSDMSIYLTKRLIPSHLMPLIPTAHHRLTEAIRISIQFLEAIRLGTNVAMTKHVLSIPFDRENLTPACHDLQTTGGFT